MPRTIRTPKKTPEKVPEDDTRMVFPARSPDMVKKSIKTEISKRKRGTAPPSRRGRY